MTDAEAPQPAPAGEGPGMSFGDALKAAREARGMTVASLAQRLRLHVKQIEALERGDLAALPSLIYVRGFIRSCARELGLEPTPLLEALDRQAGVQTGLPVASEPDSFRWSRFGDGSRAIVVIAIGILVVAAVVGLVARPPMPSATAVKTAVPVPVASNPAPAPAPAEATPTPAASAPVPVAPAPVAEVRAAVSAPSAPASVAPKATTETPKPAPATVAARPPSPSATAPAPASASAGAGAAAVLVLNVHASAWVEVVQDNGVTLLSQICPPGSVQTVKGTPPLHIVIGNAASVDAQFRGEAVDLTRHATPNGVARMTLE